MPTRKHDPRYLKGVERFNKREFFDAHEVWEALWHDLQGDDANFIQGLIQFATALHHFEARNLKGTAILYQGGMELLEGIKGLYWDLPVETFKREMTQCVAEVLKYKQEDLPGRYHPGKEKFPVQIQDYLIPKIELWRK